MNRPIVTLAAALWLALGSFSAGATISPIAMESQAIVDGLENLRGPAGALAEPGRPTIYRTATLALEMIYRARQNDRERYEKLQQLLLGPFKSPLGLAYTALDAALRPIQKSGTLADNLLACRALLAGFERWGGDERRDGALAFGHAILKYLKRRDHLVESVSWSDWFWSVHSIRRQADTVPLSDMDVAIMERLARWDSAWEPVAQKALGILAAGCITDWPRETILAGGRYTGPATSGMTFLLPLYRLVDAGFRPQRGLSAATRLLVNAPFSLWPDAEPSVAVGALSALLYEATAQPERARAVLEALPRRFAAGALQNNGLLAPVGRPASPEANLLYLLAVLRLISPTPGP